jgi:hypothetical protein
VEGQRKNGPRRTQPFGRMNKEAEWPRMQRKEYNNADGFDRAHAGENHGGW